ncbi:MAG: DUF4838 domain-containing protein, partial [Planctomycetes bacterium]|nr:DUF4838 domain-containing protein [Planctomycetota bacterium]
MNTRNGLVGSARPQLGESCSSSYSYSSSAVPESEYESDDEYEDDSRRRICRMLRRLVVMVALVSCGMSWAAEQVNLVGEGSAAVVVLPADAKGETLYAAIELSQYVGKITGRDLPLIAEGVGVYQRAARNWQVTPFARLKTRPEGKPEIHVGWTSRALKELDKAKVEKLDVDGFLIKTTSEAIFLVGPKDWSTAYAVFTFLEDFCGVRWFMPGEMGEDVPRASTLAVPLVEKTYEPAYLHRQYSGFQWRNHPELQRWAMHQKVRPRLQYHHNLYAVFDVRKHGEKYPDLYPTIDGRRRIPAAGTTAGWQPCLSHPKAVELAVEYAKEVFTKNPDASSISLGINDGGRYCECERCMKLVNPDAPKSERRAVWFFQFANKVAEQFDQLFPAKVIGYLLYGECHLPPDMKIHRRLIGFEVFPSFRLIVPEHKAEFDARMANLSKNVPVFALYDWFYGDGLCVPRLQIRQAKYWLEHGYKSGARHIKAEAYMNWGLDGFKYWMHTRLMWDPSLDVDKMLDEFFTRFFRESAKPMSDYFKVVERYTVAPITVRKDDRDVLLNFHFRHPEQLDTFPPKAVEECEPLLDQAEKLAESDLVRRRIQYYRTGFTVAKMMTIRHHLAKDAMPLLEKPETLPQGMPLLARAMSK